MALGKNALVDLYRRRARRYDLSANLYYAIGFREQAYRRHAVAALDLQPGNTVVELGCGTGLNFPLLQEQIGRNGELVGVDLTDAMLTQARRRVEKYGWSNVSLVHSDARDYEFPRPTHGVIATFALTLVPAYESVIDRAYRALGSGGRLVVLDFKQPDDMPMWLVRLGVAITASFGVTLDLAERRPWLSMASRFEEFHCDDRFLGFVYVAVGVKH